MVTIQFNGTCETQLICQRHDLMISCHPKIEAEDHVCEILVRFNQALFVHMLRIVTVDCSHLPSLHCPTSSSFFLTIFRERQKLIFTWCSRARSLAECL